MAQSKSTFTRENTIFLKLLREEREAAGITQVSLAKKLGQTQTYVSKCERGERRLDVVELRGFCHAIGVKFPEFTAKLDALIGKGATEKRAPARKLS